MGWPAHHRRGHHDVELGCAVTHIALHRFLDRVDVGGPDDDLEPAALVDVAALAVDDESTRPRRDRR